MVIREGEFDDEAAARIASVVAGRTVRRMSTYYKDSEQYLDIQFDENFHLRLRYDYIYDFVIYRGGIAALHRQRAKFLARRVLCLTSNMV